MALGPSCLNAAAALAPHPAPCPADRKAGAALRCHAVESGAELHVPYVYPSEEGGPLLLLTVADSPA